MGKNLIVLYFPGIYIQQGQVKSNLHISQFLSIFFSNCHQCIYFASPFSFFLPFLLDFVDFLLFAFFSADGDTTKCSFFWSIISFFHFSNSLRYVSRCSLYLSRYSCIKRNEKKKQNKKKTIVTTCDFFTCMTLLPFNSIHLSKIVITCYLLKIVITWEFEYPFNWIYHIW